MKKRIVLYFIVAAILLVAFFGCQDASSDFTTQAKDVEFQNAVLSELNALLTADSIEVLESDSSDGSRSLDTGEHFVFTFVNEENSKIFEAKMMKILKDVYGDNWEDYIQSDEVTSVSEQSRDIIGYREACKGTYGWLYTVAVGKAYSFTEYTGNTVYTYAEARLHYKYNGPWTNTEGWQNVGKYYSAAAVISEIWTFGFPADMVTAIGSAHIMTAAGYADVNLPLGAQ